MFKRPAVRRPSSSIAPLPVLPPIPAAPEDIGWPTEPFARLVDGGLGVEPTAPVDPGDAGHMLGLVGQPGEEAAAGDELFKLFRANVHGLADLADLAEESPPRRPVLPDLKILAMLPTLKHFNVLPNLGGWPPMPTLPALATWIHATVPWTQLKQWEAALRQGPLLALLGGKPPSKAPVRKKRRRLQPAPAIGKNLIGI